MFFKEIKNNPSHNLPRASAVHSLYVLVPQMDVRNSNVISALICHCSVTQMCISSAFHTHKSKCSWAPPVTMHLAFNFKSFKFLCDRLPKISVGTWVTTFEIWSDWKECSTLGVRWLLVMVTYAFVWQLSQFHMSVHAICIWLNASIMLEISIQRMVKYTTDDRCYLSNHLVSHPGNSLLLLRV